ncbi:MAG TPA: hypothetical protein VMU51_18170 [Mycobacteriales bacterium]|nr:hypothetical protein [Mycobacteriales bacterium]
MAGLFVASDLGALRVGAVMGWGLLVVGDVAVPGVGAVRAVRLFVVGMLWRCGVVR